MNKYCFAMQFDGNKFLYSFVNINPEINKYSDR